MPENIIILTGALLGIGLSLCLVLFLQIKQEQARFGRQWKAELDRLREQVAQLQNNSNDAAAIPSSVAGAGKEGTPEEVAAALHIPLSDARLLVRLGQRKAAAKPAAG
jgi:type II secretory pathway component PulM